MSVLLLVAILVLVLAVGLAGGWLLPRGGRLLRRDRGAPVRKILLPFTGQAISRRALEAAVRLAKAENAVIMPAFLALVPRRLSLDAPLPAQCAKGMPLLEAIEQRVSAQNVAVDSRVGRGRTYRDALRHVLEQEPVDRVIVSATASAHHGFSAEDMAWLLKKVPAEVMVLRPAPDDDRRVSAAEVAGHF